MTIMLSGLPEEILNLFVFQASVLRDEVRMPSDEGYWNESTQDPLRVLHSYRRDLEVGPEAPFDTSYTLLTVSLLSRTFHRLALPFLYAHLLVQLPRRKEAQARDRLRSESDVFPHFQHARYVVIKGGNLGSEVAHAGLFTDILSHVPRARRIDVHTDLAKCIPAFVRVVEEHQSSHVIYFDRFDMPPVDFVNGQPPPFLSNINPRFSNVCTTTMIVHDRTDFTYLADWIDTGLRMEEIVMLDSPFVAKAWSAHTYPGLKRFYVADYVDKLPNEPMVHRFLSRHRSLDEIVVGSYDTGPGVNPDKFLCSLSLGRAAGIEEVRIRRMRFVRIKPPPPAQSDDIVPFRCEFLMLSYPAIASSTEALASVVESLPKCLPGLQHLLVGTEDPTENLKWRLSSTDLNSMFANPITSSGFSELCVLALEHFWPPADLPAVPEHFQTCSVHTEGSQDTTPASCLALRLLCYSLRLSFDIACVMPRLQRVTLKWHTSEEFNEACCVDIPADYYVQRQHGTQMVLKVTDNDKSVSWPSEDIT